MSNLTKSTQETIDILLTISGNRGTSLDSHWEQYYKLQSPKFMELDDIIISVETITDRIVLLKYTKKSIILYSTNDDGDQGSDSQTILGSELAFEGMYPIRKNKNAFDSNTLIGKKIKKIEHIGCDVHSEHAYDIFKNHTYQISFMNSDDTFDFILSNRSNGYYDSCLALYLCID